MTLKDLKNSKWMNLEEAVKARESLRSKGKRLVLTNGCFDLLHVGHVSYLREARALGDALWVAMNSESSVKALKGENRPVMGDLERAYMLAGLECVDGVVIFEEERLTGEILQIRPDIYTKAGDYTLETLNFEERTALEEVGAEIHFMPFLEGYSTTGLIEKISKASGTF